ncbi:hypothetical protein D9Q98_002707 [Chlorella vulgaris]|uniref:Cas12f1-like TNB domain-containing protein n=1 Tax=Chlorella vulgaris TaxID=3077 RepID=A0A9D4TTW3_CHLVU|nr:hypothetical protein D9Q98_002707 [Chlorella vulgaris]
MAGPSSTPSHTYTRTGSGNGRCGSDGGGGGGGGSGNGNATESGGDTQEKLERQQADAQAEANSKLRKKQQEKGDQKKMKQRGQQRRRPLLPKEVRAVLRELRQQIKERTHKMFTPIPVGSLTLSHITVEPHVLQFIDPIARVSKLSKDDAFKARFDFSSVIPEGSSWSFSGMTTNGVEACVHMQRAARPPPPPPPSLDDMPAYDTSGVVVCWGADPGRISMFTAVSHVDCKMWHDVRQLSTGKYYQAVGFTQHQRWLQQQLASSEITAAGGTGLQAWQSHMPTANTSSADDLCKRIRHMSEGLRPTIVHYSSMQHLHWKLMLYGNKRRMLLSLVRQMTGGRRKDQVLVGFGNGTGGWRGPIKGHRMPPIKEFRQLLGRFATVVLVPESYTSKRCPCCEGLLKRTSTHAVNRCPECCYWDRDVAAAKNFLNVLLSHMAGQGRPAYLQKAANPPRAKKQSAAKAPAPAAANAVAPPRGPKQPAPHGLPDHIGPGFFCPDALAPAVATVDASLGGPQQQAPHGMPAATALPLPAAEPAAAPSGSGQAGAGGEVDGSMMELD